MVERAPATFVLIHGAWQGGWAWAGIVERLATLGHRAIAIDLPGNGHDDTVPGDVTTMVYAAHVAATIDAIDDEGPVIVVGHSMGGTVAAQVSELRPNRIAAAVYLCAFLLADGTSIVDFYDRAWEDWMKGAHARVSYSDDGLVSMIDLDAAQAVFYGQAEPAAARHAAGLLTPQPEGGRRSKLKLSAARFGRVPRAYIETTRDGSVFIELQRRMQAETACAHTYSLDTDHAPQLSAPDELVDILDNIAQLYA